MSRSTGRMPKPSGYMSTPGCRPWPGKVAKASASPPGVGIRSVLASVFSVVIAPEHRPPEQERSLVLRDRGRRAHHGGAAVLDVLEPAFLGDAARLGGDDALLQPQHQHTKHHNKTSDARRLGGRPEDVDQGDRLRD